MIKARGLFLVAGVCLLLIPATDAFAQRGGRGGGGGGRNMQPARPDPNKDPAVVADRQEITTLTTSMTTLTKDYDDAVKKMTDDFNTQDDVKAAQKAFDEASKELDNARNSVIANLKTNNKDYKAGLDKIKAAQAKRDQLRASNASATALQEQAALILNLTKGPDKIEADTLANDLPYMEAKKKLTEAAAALKVFKDQLVEKIKSDTDLVAKRTARDENKIKLADTTKKLQTDLQRASAGR